MNSLLGLAAGFTIVIGIIGIALYVLAALGLQRLAVNAGIPNSWLAWIPIANMYILAKIIGSLKIGSWEVPYLEYVLPGGIIATWILGFIPVIGTLVAIVYAVLYFFALYRLFSIYRPQSATLWLVLSIVLSFMGPIFIFIMRDDRPAQAA